MKSKPWTDEELRDAVTAYIDMLNKQHAGIAFIKQHYYQKLSAKSMAEPSNPLNIA